MIFGYARVSTQDQNLQLQVDQLEKYGCDEIYQEKITTRKKERPELEKMLSKLRPGDQVVCYKLDRISRSTKHLIELSERFENEGVQFVSIQDNIDTTTPMGRFFFRVMASISELERDIVSERTRSGLESARKRGRNGGRPPVQNTKIEKALKLYKSKDYSIKEIVEMTGVSQATLYRRINQAKEKDTPNQ